MAMYIKTDEFKKTHSTICTTVNILKKSHYMLKSVIANCAPLGLAEKIVPFSDNVILWLSFPFLPKSSPLTFVSLGLPPPPWFNTWGAAI